MQMRFLSIPLLVLALAFPVAAEEIKTPDIRSFYANADVAQGRVQTQICVRCHVFEKGAPPDKAPNLWGIWNRHKASTPGFTYSKAMTERRNEVWTFDDLNAYLYNPGALVPGTSHPYLGLVDNQTRANIIAYLGTLEPQPDPQPEPVLQPQKKK